MVELSPELPSVFQKLIDKKSLRYNLIFCGSSQTMMYGTFLDSTAPLYGRTSAIIKLLPFSKNYKDIIPVLFLKTKSKDDADNVILPETLLTMF